MLSVIHTIAIGTMLNSNGGNNGHRAKKTLHVKKHKFRSNTIFPTFVHSLKVLCFKPFNLFFNLLLCWFFSAGKFGDQPYSAASWCSSSGEAGKTTGCGIRPAGRGRHAAHCAKSQLCQMLFFCSGIQRSR